MYFLLIYKCIIGLLDFIVRKSNSDKNYNI